MNRDRRNFLRGTAFLGAGLVAGTKASAQHQGHNMNNQQESPKPQAPPQPETPPKIDKPHAPAGNVPVITPDLPKLPWTIENGVKVFHLTAEVVKREILPASGMGPAKGNARYGG